MNVSAGELTPRCRGVVSRLRTSLIEPSRIVSTLYALHGPVAQGLEQSAHNRSVGGSIPSGPTKLVSIRARLAGNVRSLPL